MNLIFRYLEQKGFTPRRNDNKPIRWNNLIGIRYDLQINRIPCFYEEHALYTRGMKTINIVLEFDISRIDPMKDMEGILEPSHDRLEFAYSGKHVTLKDAYLIRYDIDNQFDCGSSRLIVELIARDIIINSNVIGGF